MVCRTRDATGVIRSGLGPVSGQTRAILALLRPRGGGRTWQSGGDNGPAAFAASARIHWLRSPPPTATLTSPALRRPWRDGGGKRDLLPGRDEMAAHRPVHHPLPPSPRSPATRDGTAGGSPAMRRPANANPSAPAVLTSSAFSRVPPCHVVVPSRASPAPARRQAGPCGKEGQLQTPAIAWPQCLHLPFWTSTRWTR